MLEYRVGHEGGMIVIKSPVLDEIRRESYKIDLQFYAWLKQLRIFHGLTLVQLATASGVPQSTLSEMEQVNSKARFPDLDRLNALCDVYSLEKSDFLCAGGYLDLLAASGWYYRFWSPATVFKYENPEQKEVVKEEVKTLGTIIEDYREKAKDSGALSIKAVSEFMEKTNVSLNCAHRAILSESKKEK